MFIKENVLDIDLLSLLYFTPMKYSWFCFYEIPSAPCLHNFSASLSGARSYEQRKIPEIVPIRMADGSYITKAFWKGSSKHWSQTAQERNFLDSQELGGLCYTPHIPLSVVTGPEEHSTVGWHCTSFCCSSWRRDCLLLCISPFVYLLFNLLPRLFYYHNYQDFW